MPLTDYVDLQDSGFGLYREGTLSSLEPDDLASDGVAARMPGDHKEWAIQQRLSIPASAEEVEWVCYAVARCETKGTDGVAFAAGIYDTESKQSLGGVTVQCADVEGSDYYVYEIATTQLSSSAYIWVAPGENGENVEAIFVDRMFLVRQR